MMDPAGPPDCPLEPREKRKIQFAVPATEPTQLDPRQVEMIRRRRPTPATLFRVSEQTSPEDDASCHQWVVGENGVLKPKRINTSVYQPPSLKAVQQMAEAHMQESGAQLEEEEHKGEEHEWEEHEDPVRVRREFSCSSDPAEQNPEKQGDARASDTTEEEEERDEDLH